MAQGGQATRPDDCAAHAMARRSGPLATDPTGRLHTSVRAKARRSSVRRDAGFNVGRRGGRRSLTQGDDRLEPAA
jgi:hypothetical protein